MIRVRRGGITLIEVVVVLAIIGFLFALFMPAVDMVRKHADRIRGQNNLRQLALAMHNYGGAFAKLPPIAGPGANGTHGSLFFQLLPFIEQEAVYRQGDVWKAGTIGLRLDILVDPRDKTAPADGRFEGWLGTTNYAGNWLVFKTGDNRFPAAIPDGTSNTIGFTERYQVCNGTPCGWGYDRVYYWAPMTAYYSDGKFQVTPRDRDCDPARPQALDAAGIQVAICDGSVRLVGGSISPITWHYALTPDGGEILGPDWND